MINNHVTVQLISTFGYLASSVTLSAYNLVRSYLKDVSMKFILTASNGIWLVLELYLLIIGISSGSSSSSAAESFHDTGYAILRDRKILSFQCKEDFKEFLESKRHSNFQFVSAFFDINWRLLLSVCVIEFANFHDKTLFMRAVSNNLYLIVYSFSVFVNSDDVYNNYMPV
ncbi:hypothetical protein ACKWTF_011630 [Chironomus riparius]